ncbi:MAG: tyrosine-type recombinase/integrase [Candidatus Gastranaerophilales bacterium]|nr:tyrosine-type recombinase/integrase [Candidatus Gastranaerophilales bacterium]
MSEYCLENEIIKKKYYDRLRIKKQPKTINQIAKAVEKFEEFTGYKNLKLFNFKMAEKYIKHLRDEGLSLNTINSYLRHLRGFFEWLSMQSGYKSRINLSDVELLSLSNNELNSINKRIVLDYPTFEQAKAIFNSISPINEVDKRDKALIALAVLTGMRAESLMSVSIGAVNLNKMEVLQKNAKFGKEILTKIFNFDDEMQAYFIEWYKYLKEVKLYSNTDPLFPKTKARQTEENLSFVYDEVEPAFWQSHSSISNAIKNRAIQANLPAFSPHKYRHLSIYLALQKCKNGLEIKAISQHFGHEDVRTALETYSNLSSVQLSETLGKINNNSNSVDENKLNLAIQLIDSMQNSSSDKPTTKVF